MKRVLEHRSRVEHLGVPQQFNTLHAEQNSGERRPCVQSRMAFARDRHLNSILSDHKIVEVCNPEIGRGPGVLRLSSELRSEHTNRERLKAVGYPTSSVCFGGAEVGLCPQSIASGLTPRFSFIGAGSAKLL